MQRRHRDKIYLKQSIILIESKSIIHLKRFDNNV